MQVSGIIILDYIRLIRANKAKNWDRWLEPEDWQIINGELNPAEWYPYPVFRRLGWAAYQEIAEGNPDLTEQFGRFNMQSMMQVYRDLLVSNDPIASVTKAAQLWAGLFRGTEVESVVTDHGEDWVTYMFRAPVKESDCEMITAYAHQVGGQLIELVTNAGGAGVSADVTSENRSRFITVRWN